MAVKQVQTADEAASSDSSFAQASLMFVCKRLQLDEKSKFAAGEEAEVETTNWNWTIT